MKMNKFFLFLSITFSASVDAMNFEYKGVNDFKALSQYANVGEFELAYQSYKQNCLDNTGGGTGGMRCLIDLDIWDRELNIYYKKVYQLLDDEGQKLLKASQRAWIKERDHSIALNTLIVDKKFKDLHGTMHYLMRANDRSTAIYPIVKERALVLKRWYDYINKNKNDF